MPHIAVAGIDGIHVVGAVVHNQMQRHRAVRIMNVEILAYVST